jgi:hypothetical protein
MDSRPGDETLLLLVLGLMPFAVQTDISHAGLICIFGWVFAASRAGRTAGPRPRQVANCGLVLLAGIPVALYPVWLIVLSYRLPGQLADRAGSARRSSPTGPGSRASSAASGHMVMRGEGDTT